MKTHNPTIKELKTKLQETVARLKVYRRKYWIQVSISIVLVLVLAVSLYQEPFSMAAPTQDSYNITSQAQFDQGTFSDTVSQDDSGGEVVLDGSGGANWWSANYSLRKLLTITSQDALANDYTVFHTEDLEALVSSNKAQSDYDDIRIVAYDRVAERFEAYDTDGSIIEDTSIIGVDRHIVGTDSIRFKILSSITASSTSEASGDHSYYIYYSNPSATDPPERTRNVYLNKNVDMEDGDPRPDYWYKTSIYQGPEPFKSSNEHYNGEYSLAKEGSSNQRDLGMSTIVPMTSGDKVHASLYLKIDNTAGGVYVGSVNGGTEADGTGYPGYVWWVTSTGDTGGEWEYFETTYTASGSYNYRIWIYPYGFTGDVYADMAVIRRYVDNAPSSVSGSEESAMASSGTWTSPSNANAVDIVWNGGWSDNGNGNAFEANITLPADTGTDFEMRLSDDRSSWTSWYDMTDADGDAGRYGVAAATLEAQFPQATYETYRYLQIRATLTQTNGSNSPTLSDFSIYYLKDVDPPSSNPTSANCYTDSGMGTELTTDTWYNDNSIYCTWSGASDEHSGIGGYYVYFGTNSSADPAVLGAQQSAANYTKGSMTSGSTYYLRIKAYDLVGNTISTTYQAFIYKHDLTIPTSPGVVAANPAGYTNTNDFDFLWAAGTDAHSGV
ncbi:hypothetical protein KJ782_06790, partial [Patescibacteria group bacterium]|nr:hypothetical protein [Patescibacteria group bacterium]